MKKHKVIIVPGLGDNKVFHIKFATNHWTKKGLDVLIHRFDWMNNYESFETKFNRLLKLVDSLVLEDNTISLVGLSAGGSAVLNVLVERKKMIHKVVNICGRLRTGSDKGFRTLRDKSKNSPSFYKSVKYFEKKEKSLNSDELQRIMTVRAKFGDELVPSNTVSIEEAYNITIPTIEHVLSIGLALSVFSKEIISFLQKEH